MESENLNSDLSISIEDLAVASKLHLRLRRLSKVNNMEEVAVEMFEFFAHLQSPHLTSIQENLFSMIEQEYGIE